MNDYLKKSQANGVRHYPSFGIAAMIRSALRAGPLTANQIAVRIGRHPERVRHALGTIINITGGIVSEGSRYAKLYRLFEPKQSEEPADVDRPYRFAGKIVHGRGAKWGAGLV